MLLKDRDLWQRMSAAGLEWARALTWERCASEMEKIILREIERGGKS